MQAQGKMCKSLMSCLQVRRDQNPHRQFTLKDVQSMQSLQQQLRLYVAKLRTMLEPVRKQARTYFLSHMAFLYILHLLAPRDTEA